MTYFTTALLCLVVWAGASSRDTGAQDRAAADEVLARAREALGGSAQLDAVKSFIVTGRTRRVQSDTLGPIEFQIACELPNKYVRHEPNPAPEGEPDSLGFNGGALILRPRAAMALAPHDADQLSLARQEFARLTLGMFATSFSSYPLSFVRAGTTQAPEGAADVLDVIGPPGSNFKPHLLISTVSRLPLMLTWQMTASNVLVTVPGQARPEPLAPGTIVVEGPPVPPADASKAAVDAFIRTVADLRRRAMATLVEHRLYYADYRAVGVLRLPFKLRRTIGADTIEDIGIETYAINPRIDPRTFDASR